MDLLEWNNFLFPKIQTLDISMRLRSNPESPDNLLDPPVGERKISSRLNRNKSTKCKEPPPSSY